MARQARGLAATCLHATSGRRAGVLRRRGLGGRRPDARRRHDGDGEHAQWRPSQLADRARAPVAGRPARVRLPGPSRLRRSGFPRRARRPGKGARDRSPAAFGEVPGQQTSRDCETAHAAEAGWRGSGRVRTHSARSALPDPRRTRPLHGSHRTARQRHRLRRRIGYRRGFPTRPSHTRSSAPPRPLHARIGARLPSARIRRPLRPARSARRHGAREDPRRASGVSRGQDPAEASHAGRGRVHRARQGAERGGLVRSPSGKTVSSTDLRKNAREAREVCEGEAEP